MRHARFYARLAESVGSESASPQARKLWPHCVRAACTLPRCPRRGQSRTEERKFSLVLSKRSSELVSDGCRRWRCGAVTVLRRRAFVVLDMCHWWVRGCWHAGRAGCWARRDRSSANSETDTRWLLSVSMAKSVARSHRTGGHLFMWQVPFRAEWTYSTLTMLFPPHRPTLNHSLQKNSTGIDYPALGVGVGVCAMRT